VSEEFTAAIEKAGGVASDTEEPGGGRALVFGFRRLWLSEKNDDAA
jgi:hypothetical protein